MTCPVCEYAVLHGWWGPTHRGTHCRDCHRSWTAKSEAHCTTCCRQFSTDRAAGMHRVATGGCQNPAGVLRTDGTALFKVVERGSGPVWVVDRPVATHLGIAS